MIIKLYVNDLIEHQSQTWYYNFAEQITSPNTVFTIDNSSPQ